MKRCIEGDESKAEEEIGNKNKRAKYIDTQFLYWWVKRVMYYHDCANSDLIMQTESIFEFTKRKLYFDFVQSCNFCLTKNEKNFCGCWHNQSMCHNKSCQSCKCYCETCKLQFCPSHFSSHMCSRSVMPLPYLRLLIMCYIIRREILEKRNLNVCLNVSLQKCDFCFRRKIVSNDNVIGYNGNLVKLDKYGIVCRQTDCPSYHFETKEC